PNPFNPSTQIGYRIADDQRVRVAIYDVSGALVRMLVDASQPAGAYTVTWSGANDEGLPVSSGVYFYRLEAGKLTQTRRMVLLK
ncbi:MAG: T9SS type A sorting domain-containing protein, partial [Candidatus Krumholzibacteria bacterium]|nr:T9SS type A sorting domain-containing protein [Candidatus Krumholzibacteria bacterium]